MGIDTPETVDPRKPVECFGKEATQKMKELVDSKTVKLVRGKESSNRDRYSRLLRYIYLIDNTFVNAEMIKQGYAYAYTKYPFEYMEEFKRYEREARENNRGLWAPGVCEAEQTKQQEEILTI
ncbi:MAG: thermonuclease family protein [bacterium]